MKVSNETKNQEVSEKLQIYTFQINYLLLYNTGIFLKTAYQQKQELEPMFNKVISNISN